VSVPVVLFVDDEPNILQGLRRMLKQARVDWSTRFAGSGSEALNMLADTPADIVVSDMRMPGMNGAQLLREIQRRHPQTIRLILSGHSEEEALLDAAEVSHQFLSKPCNVETLLRSVNGALNLRGLLNDEALRRLVTSLSSIPSPPSIYEEVTRAARSDMAGLKAVAQIIEKDPALSARILGLANSAFLGSQRSHSSIGSAIGLLGLDTIRSLVLQHGLVSQLSVGDIAGWAIDDFLRHSLEHASLAARIARAEGLSPAACEEAFIAGLLHDVGLLVMADNLGTDYAALIRSAAADGQPLAEIERLTLGGSHAEVGAYVLGVWGLPIGIVNAVAQHHDLMDPGRIDPAGTVRLARLLLAEEADPAHAWLETEATGEAMTRFPEARLAAWRCLRDTARKGTPCP